MANPTTNFGFIMPESTDLVTNLPADFDIFGQAVDNTLAQFTTKLLINAQSGVTYTFIAGDLGKFVTANNAGAITITVPPSLFVAGNTINVQQIGAGQVTFAQGSGVTITSTGASSSAPKLRVQFSACTIICVASNSFTVVGDIA